MILRVRCVSTRAVVGLSVLFAVLQVAPVFGVDERVIDTDICALTAHPKYFANKTVRVRARVVSSVEGTALFADSCEPRGVALWVPKDARENHDQKALDDAIFRKGYVGTVGKKITATFTGQFLWRPRKHPRRVLMAEKVEDLRVEFTKPDEKH